MTVNDPRLVTAPKKGYDQNLRFKLKVLQYEVHLLFHQE